MNPIQLHYNVWDSQRDHSTRAEDCAPHRDSRAHRKTLPAMVHLSANEQWIRPRTSTVRAVKLFWWRHPRRFQRQERREKRRWSSRARSSAVSTRRRDTVAQLMVVTPLAFLRWPVALAD